MLRSLSTFSRTSSSRLKRKRRLPGMTLSDRPKSAADRMLSSERPLSIFHVPPVCVVILECSRSPSKGSRTLFSRFTWTVPPHSNRWKNNEQLQVTVGPSWFPVVALYRTVHNDCAIQDILLSRPVNGQTPLSVRSLYRSTRASVMGVPM